MANAVITNALVPKSASITVGTTAVQIKTSPALAIKFTIASAASNGAANLYLGDSNVSKTQCIPIAKGTSLTLGETKYARNESASYDLSGFYLLATASNQVAALIIYQGKTTGQGG